MTALAPPPSLAHPDDAVPFSPAGQPSPAAQPAASPSAAPVRLHPTHHRVSMTRYACSHDPRGFMPVYEYSISGVNAGSNQHTIMIDAETSYVLFTPIWKALGHAKADVVKLIESSPDVASQIKKVRGGYLKVQGTWMPFSMARMLARRVAYNIRQDLIPLFGPDFPEQCLTPGQPGYGQLLLSQPKQRASIIRRPMAPRSQESYGPLDASSHPASLGAFHQPHPYAFGPQRFPMYQAAERYSPYHSAPRSPYAYLPTPPPSSGFQGGAYYYEGLPQRRSLEPLTLSAGSGGPPGASSNITWRRGFERHTSPVYGALTPQSSNMPLPPLPKGRLQTPSAADEEAISSLMSMATRTPTFVMTPETASHAAPLHSLPSSQPLSPRSATHPSSAPPTVSKYPANAITHAPLQSASYQTWSQGRLVQPGFSANESHLRSGSEEPDMEAVSATEEVRKVDSNEEAAAAASTASEGVTSQAVASV